MIVHHRSHWVAVAAALSLALLAFMIPFLGVGIVPAIVAETETMLRRLDVVVASVHSKLRMERFPMTMRMLRAVQSPHVDILGHCTGRLLEKRPPSTFDADYVFAACKQFGTAVEINCRPERLDPPRELLDVAIDYGCWFSIDTDAHATGQLEWQPFGCDRAAERDVPIDKVINTMSAADLLAWTSAGG